MKIDVFTLFPDWLDWFRAQRHVANALAHGHSLEGVDLRATTPLQGGRVDDTPYGGGAGMVIRVDVVEAALPGPLGRRRGRGPRRPAGGGAGARRAPVRRRAGRRAGRRGRAGAPAAGRYEGFDERVHEHLATDVVSIGPYVLAGGELAAMVVCDAVLRKLPGRAGPRGQRATRSRSARRSRAGPSTRTTPGPPSGAAPGCPRCSPPATTPGCASGGWSAAASGPRGRP